MVIFNTPLKNRRKYTTIFWNVQEKKQKNDLWLDFYFDICKKNRPEGRFFLPLANNLSPLAFI